MTHFEDDYISAGQLAGSASEGDRPLSRNESRLGSESSLGSKSPLAGSVVIVGNFDGLHRGHAKLIELARAQADRVANVTAQRPRVIALTFSPHPVAFFSKRENFEITSLRDKLRMFHYWGLDGAAVVKFDKDLASMDAHEFMRTVIGEWLDPVAIVTGDDFRFGKNRSAGVEDLVRYSSQQNDGPTVITAQLREEDGESISSSRIRNYLRDSNFGGAADLLDRPYFLSGKVVPGAQIGRTVGFPTANLDLTVGTPTTQGIYAAAVKYRDEIFVGAASWGVRPVFDNGQPVYEIHILDFDRDIYGEFLDAVPIRRLRDELKLNSVAELITQIKKDCEQTRLISKTPEFAKAAAFLSRLPKAIS